MSRSLSEIRADIQSLPEEERAILLRELIAGLDDERDPDAEALWIQEAHRRLQELDSGAVKPIPVEEVFERIQTRLEK